MKKKLTVLLAGVIAVSSFAIGAYSKDLIEKIEAEIRPDFTVVIDGEKQVFKTANGNTVYPVLYEGTTYLPIRAIGELMGKKVYWYQDEKRIELVEPTTEVTVTDADVIIDALNEKKEKAEKVNKEKVEKVQKKEVETSVTLEEAKEAVLKKAGLKEEDVVFTKAKLENDDGKLVFNIDFKNDKTKYDAEVDAETGEIVEWEVEEKKVVVKEDKTQTEAITLEEAKEIALKKAGLKENEVVFTKAKLDNDDNVKVYEIEFKKDRVEYEAEINPADGTVLEWNVDND